MVLVMQVRMVRVVSVDRVVRVVRVVRVITVVHQNGLEVPFTALSSKILKWQSLSQQR